MEELKVLVSFKKCVTYICLILSFISYLGCNTGKVTGYVSQWLKQEPVN
jgi:hypothetical protein